MRKLFNTLLIGVTTILLSSSYSVYASEHNEVYKCTKQDGSVVFQDFACVDAKAVEATTIKNYEPSVNSGLREYEKVVLERSVKRRADEQKIRAMIKAAIINQHKTLDHNIQLKAMIKTEIINQQKILDYSIQ